MHSIALLAAATLTYIIRARALSCHCLNNAACDPANFNCSNGCEEGWYGPGCQIGNLAFRKTAFQSTTYSQNTADYAVNGFYPPLGDTSERNCTHTEVTNGPSDTHWWYVILSDTEDFVLKNITIVQRQRGDLQDGYNGYAHSLWSFYILYTSSACDRPDPASWDHCAFHENIQLETSATYTCERTAVGRRVAVFLNGVNKTAFNRKLCLCEVYVDGFSYSATSLSQLLPTDVRADCNSIAITISKLPVVPPTYIVVNLKYTLNDEETTNEIYFITDGLRSLTLRVMANRTYIVSLAPETCCIGSQCLNNLPITDHTKCEVGQSTQPINAITPLYRQYALYKHGNIVNVAAINNNECSSTDQRIQCSRIPDSSRLAVSSNSNSCELDPRYNYTCMLTVSYTDGFNSTSVTDFRISTAEFAAIQLYETATCDSVTLVLENISAQWDVAPTHIAFYLSSTIVNKTFVTSVPTNIPGTVSVKFSVASNSTYSAWAAPITYLSRNQSTDMLYGNCSELVNCIVGSQTPIRSVKTLQRQYLLKNQDCCVALLEFLPNQCEKPFGHYLNCTHNGTNSSDVLTNNGYTVCGLKPNTSYTCHHILRLNDGEIESYNYYLEAENLTECFSRESSSSNVSSDVSAAVTGTISAIVAIATVVAVLTLYQRKINIMKSAAQQKQPEENVWKANATNDVYVLPVLEHNDQYESLKVTHGSVGEQEYASLN